MAHEFKIKKGVTINGSPIVTGVTNTTPLTDSPYTLVTESSIYNNFLLYTPLTQFNQHTGDTTIHYLKSEINLGDLGDVNISGVLSGDSLFWSGGTWIVYTPTDQNNFLTGVNGDGNSTGVTFNRQDLSDIIWDASHNHNDLYYTENEANTKFVYTTGDTMTGNLNLENADLLISGDTYIYGSFRLYNQSGDTSIEYDSNIGETNFHNVTRIYDLFYLMEFTGSSSEIVLVDPDGLFRTSELIKVNDDSIDTGYNLLFDTGDETYFPKVFKYDGGTSGYTDITITVGGFNNNVSVLEKTSDYVYFGKEDKFDTILFASTAGNASGITNQVEYWDGSAWQILSINDGTSGFTVSERNDTNDWLPIINWTTPGDWAQNTVSGETYYWTRISTTTSPVSNPNFELIRPGDNRPFGIKTNNYDTETAFRTDDKGFFELEHLIRFYSPAWSVVEFYSGPDIKIKNSTTNRSFTFQYDTIDNPTEENHIMMQINYNDVIVNDSRDDIDFSIRKNIVVEDAYRYDALLDTHTYNSDSYFNENLNVGNLLTLKSGTSIYDISIDSGFTNTNDDSIATTQAIKNYLNNGIEYEVHVSKNGNDNTATGSINQPYLTLKAALSGITDNSTTKRYVIKIGPGIYEEEAPLTLKSSTKIEGSGLRNVVIQPLNSGDTLFQGVNGTIISTLTINNANIGLEFSGAGICLFDQILCSNCQTGFYLNNNDANITGTDLIFATSSTEPIDKGVHIESGLMNIQNPIIFGPSYLNNIFYLDGNESKLIVSTLLTESSNVGNCVYANDNADVVMLSGKYFNCDKAIVVGATGTTTRVVARGVSIRDTQTYDVDIQGSGLTMAYRGFNTCIRRDKINNLSLQPNAIKSQGFDSFEDNFRTIGDTVIGLDGVGSRLSVGEGGEYKFNLKIFEYNGSTYTEKEVSDNISFPNTNINTAIYIGDIDSYNFYALNFYLNTLLSGNTLLFEYYDGGISDWLEFDTLSTLREYSNSINGTPFTDYSGYTNTVRFDQNIETGVLENNTGATGWAETTISGVTGKWIRIRIATGITSSMEITDLRIIGNVFEIRKNGTLDFYGQARAEKLFQVTFGDQAGTTSNQTAPVSQNVTYRYRENKFVDGANDATNFRFTLPDDIDTSCGIKTILEFAGNSSNSSGSDQKAILHLNYAAIPYPQRFNGSYTEDTTLDLDWNFENGYLSAIQQRLTLNNRIDISNLIPGDQVFFELERLANETGDDYASDVTLLNVTLKYRVWENGSNFLE
jgi:hypothetical protein